MTTLVVVVVIVKQHNTRWLTDVVFCSFSRCSSCWWCRCFCVFVFFLVVVVAVVCGSVCQSDTERLLFVLPLLFKG